MLTLRYVRKTRAFLYPQPVNAAYNPTISFCYSAVSDAGPTSTASTSGVGFYPSLYPFLPSAHREATNRFQPTDLAGSFRDWFRSRAQENAVFYRIFEILGAHEDSAAADLALSSLNLRLSEGLVLKVLNHGKDVLSCLKFFDWAGRQRGFYHSRRTFHAIFKILSRAKLMSLMMDFLDSYRKQDFVDTVRFHDTLVIGYAVAGKLEVALQLFGKMRFQGIDLDSFSYHVLLNALVEEGWFDAVETLVSQIRDKGYEKYVTHSILLKYFCKQKQFDEGESYIRGLLNSGLRLSGNVVAILVDGLCKNYMFERAGRLVEEFREMGVLRMDHAYGVWIRDLVQAGKLDGALDFLQSKKSVEGYVPDVFRYNMLICWLLKENRFEEVFDLLIDMREHEILPDEVTMNAVLCFFCKVGMADVALELYDSRAEFGLSPSSMAYNFLINTLCGDGSIDDAYRVLKNSIDNGYFPAKKTLSILADALCREGRLDKAKELILVAMEQNFMPSDVTFDHFISALCHAGKVEDGYLVHWRLNTLNKVASKKAYFNLINGFKKSSRGDIAARLLIEMQEKGHQPNQKLFRDVISCLCDMEDPEKQFLRLLEMQLSCDQPSCSVYNIFIDGAGHAGKPELARQAYEMMGRTGVKPNLSSDTLLLQSYLKNNKISEALKLFNDLTMRRAIGKKLWYTIIIGLCKADKPDLALDMMREMRAKNVRPSLQCYEELIKLLCQHGKYYKVVNLVDDLLTVGRHVSSFVGNNLLLCSLSSESLLKAWVIYSSVKQDVMPSILRLGELVQVFYEGQNIEDIERLIDQCFPHDTYTYNMLLKKLSMSNMEHAYEFFERLCRKGFEPNRWTYEILVHGFLKHRMTAEAKLIMQEMFRRGFEPSIPTELLL